MTRCLLLANAVLLTLALSISAAAQDSLSEDLDTLTDLVARPLAKRALRWECTPSVRYVCTPDGCEQSQGLVSVRLDVAKHTYSRCDAKGCESYSMTFSAGGVFTTIGLPASQSTFLKVVNDGSQYLEVATLQLAVHQNFGVCKPLP